MSQDQDHRGEEVGRMWEAADSDNIYVEDERGQYSIKSGKTKIYKRTINKYIEANKFLHIVN